MTLRESIQLLHSGFKMFSELLPRHSLNPTPSPVFEVRFAPPEASGSVLRIIWVDGGMQIIAYAIPETERPALLAALNPEGKWTFSELGNTWRSEGPPFISLRFH